MVISLAFLIVLVLFFIVVVTAVVVAVVVATRHSSGSRPRHPHGSPSSAPLDLATVAEVSRLVRSGETIRAVKTLREATGLGLKEAHDRVVGWSELLELEAARGHAQQPGVPLGAQHAAPDTGTGGPERVRIEAAAVLATSGWHTAEAFLREERGYSAEAAKALLDSLN